MTNIDTIKDTVRKLLNLAKNDAAYDGEVENAIKFAQKLMAQHNISEADLIEASTSREMSSTFAWGNGRTLCSWEIMLASFIRDFLGSVVTLINKNVTPRRTEIGTLSFDADENVVEGQSVHFFGIPEEALLAKNLYENLALTIATMARLKYGTALRKEGREYGDGFILGLYEKLEKAKQEQKQLTQQSTALVVKKYDLVKQEYIKRGGTFGKKIGPKTVKVTRAYNEGVKDGTNADVSANRTKKIGRTRGLLY
jgi:hypothetical protein